MTESTTQRMIANSVELAAQRLMDGGVIAIPTDTVYGLAAALDHPAAIARIYQLKGRDDGKPMPVLVSDMHAVERLTTRIDPLARALMKRFWPGALTIVLPAASMVPEEVRRGGSTVGVRMPDNELAVAIISKAGGAVAVTSANRSGSPEATSAAMVREIFGCGLGWIVDGGECNGGRPSTVVQLVHGEPRILRCGAINEQDLRRALDRPCHAG